MKINLKGIEIIVISFILTVGCETPKESADTHLQKGKTYFEKGELNKAFVELKSSSQEEKKADTYYYMALIDEKSNNFKSMKQNLLSALELDPGYIDARMKLARLELVNGKLETSLEQAEIVLNNNPESLEAKFIKATVYVKLAKYDEANKIIEPILSKSPDNEEFLTLKATEYYQLNEIDKTLSLIEEVLRKNPTSFPIRLFRIKINILQNNINAVIEDYKELIRLDPEASGYIYALAAIYDTIKNHEEAEKLLRGMVDNQPDNLQAKIILLEFLNTKNSNRVISEYDKWLVNNNKQPDQLFELSKWMLQNNYEDSATKGLKQVVEKEENNNSGLAAQTILAEIALKNNQYEIAENAIEKILKANSEFIQASLLKARLLLSQNKVDEAIDLLNKSVWSKDESGDANSLLGQAYLAKKDGKQADKYFKQALEVNPANITAFYPVYNSYINANQKEVARQYLEKALKLKPNQSLLLTSKIELDIEEKKWDAAWLSLQQLTPSKDNKSNLLYLKANIMQGMGKYAQAIPLYEEVLEEFPGHVNSMIDLFRCYEGIKSREKGIAYLVSHHQKYPKNIDVVIVLSDIYVTNKEPAKAKELFVEQLKDNPNEVTLYLLWAKIEASLQKSPQGAKEVYLKGLEKNPDDQKLWLALAGLNEQIGDINAAKNNYEHLLEIHPDNNLAINNLATLLIESNKTDDLIKGLSLAEKLKNVDYPYYQDTYAWALLKNGQTIESLKLLESLVLRVPKLPEFRYHLGVAFFNNGNLPTATAELKQALALSDKQLHDFNGKADAIKMLKQIENNAKH